MTLVSTDISELKSMFQMTMYIATNDDSYANDVRNFLDSWGPGRDIHYTPGGLAWRDQWGPNRYAGKSSSWGDLGL